MIRWAKRILFVILGSVILWGAVAPDKVKEKYYPKVIMDFTDQKTNECVNFKCKTIVTGVNYLYLFDYKIMKLGEPTKETIWR